MHWIDFHQLLPTEPQIGGLALGIAVGLLLSIIGLVSRAQPSATPDSASIEVRLHYGSTVETAQLTPQQGSLAVLLPDSSSPILHIQPGETVTLGRRQGDVYVRRDDASLYARSLRFVPTTGGHWTLEPGTQFTQTYSGALTFSPDTSGPGILFVNRVPLGDYVASVVAAEYGLGDRAGAKAMAVVARTYALFTSEHPASSYEHVDGTASQVYRGTGVITETSRRATRQTRGQILVHEGEPIQAVYFSSSGGHTADNEDVWTDSDPLPYLRGKRDPYDRVSPYHRWTSRVNRKALLRALSLHQNDPVEGFLLGDRIDDRRLATIELLHPKGTRTEIEASTFRSVVNEQVDGTPIKSTWFSARREGPQYVFEGRGYGHGVGLNQWGAHAMAQQGKDYRDILSFYYTDVQIEQRQDLPPPRPPLADDATVILPDTTARDTSSRRVGW